MDINQKLIKAEDESLDVGGQSKLTTWTASIMLFLVFLVVLGCIVIWVVVHPENLEYTVEEAYVTRFDLKTVIGNQIVNNINISSPNANASLSNSFNITAVQHRKAISYLNADFSFNMSIRNPNYRLNFTYDNMTTVVWRDDKNLTSITLPGFFQGRNTTIPKDFTLSLRNEKVVYPVSRNLVVQKHARVYIRVDLTLTTNLNFTARHWKSETRKIEIYCADVMVQLLPSNSTSERTRCTVQIM